MQHIIIYILTISSLSIPLVGAATARTADSSEAPAGIRDLTIEEANLAMSHVYGGKTRFAALYLDSLSVVCGDEPFYLLIKARVARERLTIDDEVKDRLIADAAPIERDLDRVIEVCTQRIEVLHENEESQGDLEATESKLLLYRGLAWMGKSHICAFAHRYWRAGRHAKKGKSDLEDYLRSNPGDPLAMGSSGVFLYFADMIPTVLKLFSKMVFMPSGDREKGLRFIEAAAASQSVFRLDYQLAQSNINLLFEGRYEDGLDGAVNLLGRHGSYARLVVPLALMQPFSPLTVSRNAVVIDEMLATFDGRDTPPHATADPELPVESYPGEAERYVLALLDFLNAYADRFVAPPDVAEAGLRRIADAPVSGPDWIGGYAAFELGRLLASQGRHEEARTVFSWVKQHPGATFLHDDARKMAQTLESDPTETPLLKPPWITGIYFGDPVERTRVLRELRKVSPATVQTLFYLGDAMLLSGDTEGAFESFVRVLEWQAKPWDEEFQMLAACRVAEIHGARGAYGDAAESLGRALKHYSEEYLVDWMLEGRRRYYQKLQDGEDLPPPSVITPTR